MKHAIAIVCGLWIVAIGVFFVTTRVHASTGELIYQQETQTSWLSFGRTAANATKRAFLYNSTSTQYLCQTDFYISANTGSPSDNVVVSLLSGGNTPALSSTMTSETLTAAQWSVPGWYSMTWDSCYYVASSTKVWVEFSRTGTVSDTDYYNVGYNSAAATYYDDVYNNAGGSWTSNNVRPQIRWYGWQQTVDLGTATPGMDPFVSLFLSRYSTTTLTETTSTINNISSSCPDLYLIKGFCEFTAWLFIPQLKDVSPALDTVSETFSIRFPFSWFVGFYAAMTSSTQATTSTPFTISMSMPTSTMVSMHMTSTSNALVLFSITPTSTTQYLRPQTLSLIRTTATLLLYMGFASYALYRANWYLKV